MSRPMPLTNLVEHRVLLLGACPEASIWMVASDHRAMWLNHHDVETIELVELGRLRACRSRHAAHGGIQRDQVLHRDRAEHFALTMARDLLFQLERRLQSRGPAAVAHDAAFELVDRQDRRVLHQIVDVTVQQRVRVQRVLDGGQNGEMPGVIEIRARQQPLDLAHAFRRQRHVPRHLLDDEVHVWCETPDDAIGIDGGGGRLYRATSDDERNPRLVQQDRVGFVDHRGGKWPQHLFVRMESEAIAQVVEPQLVGGCVGDVAPVRRPSIVQRHVLPHGRHGEAEPPVCLPHPCRIAAGEIVVHGEHMDAASLARIPRHSGNRRQRLAFARLHLHNPSVRQRECAFELRRRTSAARVPARPRQR